MITKFESYNPFNEEDKAINDSYDDYTFDRNCSDEYKKILARQIRRTAEGFIKYQNGRISEWVKKFKDEDIVMKELEPLIMLDDVKKYNL